MNPNLALWLNLDVCCKLPNVAIKTVVAICSFNWKKSLSFCRSCFDWMSICKLLSCPCCMTVKYLRWFGVNIWDSIHTRGLLFKICTTLLITASNCSRTNSPGERKKSFLLSSFFAIFTIFSKTPPWKWQFDTIHLQFIWLSDNVDFSSNNLFSGFTNFLPLLSVIVFAISLEIVKLLQTGRKLLCWSDHTVDTPPQFWQKTSIAHCSCINDVLCTIW